MDFGIWQIVHLVLVFMGFGATLAKHGKPKKGEENALAALVGIVLGLFILYKGGFFS